MSGDHSELYKEMGHLRQQVGELSGKLETESKNAAEARSEVSKTLKSIDDRLRANELKGAKNGLIAGGVMSIAISVIANALKGTPG
jgi:hypothetical protein